MANQSIQRPLDADDHPARQAARTWRAKCPWASYADMEQEAFVATTMAMRGYKPEIGDINGYLYKAAYYAIKAKMHLEFSAVSVKWRSHKDLFRARCAVPLLSDDKFAQAYHSAIDTDPTPLQVMLQMPNGWADRVRARLAELLTDDKHTQRAIPVLLGTADSTDVAREHNVSVLEIYRATQRAKRRIAADACVQALYQEQLA